MRIGIIGAGQLGRMLALAGLPLGLKFRFLDRSAQVPGGQVGPILVGDFDNRDALLELAAGVDVITFDWENVPAPALALLEKTVRVCPSPRALATSQDRLLEKELFRHLGIPTPPFAAVETREQLLDAAGRIGMPGVLKTRRLGYDGKGQSVVRTGEDLEQAWQALGGHPLIYEAFVEFTREVSIIGARNPQGEVAVYPLSANTHLNGILRYTTAPYSNRSLQQQARRHLGRVLRHFDYVGVLAIEFFVERGRLLANEMAPRVHNSGHWTIEGAATSQFENHLRAILGWPLGSAEARGHSAMINFIGALPDAGHLLREPNLHFHDYGKAARPGRKLGHCTLVETSTARRDARLRKLLK